MALSAGTKLGVYDIVSAIDAGGMGEVYRARDPKLGRDVAIKILPEAFGGDPDARGTVSARSAAARIAEPSTYRGHLRVRGVGRHPRDCAGARRRPDARRPHSARAASARRGAA